MTNLALWQLFGPNAVSSVPPVHLDPCQTICAYPIRSEENERLDTISSHYNCDHAIENCEANA